MASSAATKEAAVADQAMSSTSRVLRENELASVAPIWWRESDTPPPAPVQAVRSAPSNGTGGALEGALEREAYQKGFAEGTAVGKEQAAIEVQPVLDRLSHSLGELASVR